MDPLEAQLLLFRVLFLFLSYGFALAIGAVAWQELRAGRREATAASRAPGPRLIVVDGADSDRAPGFAFPVLAVTAIGRDLDNQVVLMDPTVSGRHAVIHHRDGAWWLEDLRSTNGSRVNGRVAAALDPCLLRSGDLVQVGAVRLRLVSPEL